MFNELPSIVASVACLALARESSVGAEGVPPHGVGTQGGAFERREGAVKPLRERIGRGAPRPAAESPTRCLMLLFSSWPFPVLLGLEVCEFGDEDLPRRRVTFFISTWARRRARASF